jgi:hypothetical protein
MLEVSPTKYFILSIDDYSRMMNVMFMKVKYHAFDMFKLYKDRVEKEIGKTLKNLRFDRDDEFMSTKFTNFYAESGIKR